MKTVGYATCNKAGQVLWAMTMPDNEELGEAPTAAEGQVVRRYAADAWPGMPCYWDDVDGRFVQGYAPNEDLQVLRTRVQSQLEASYNIALFAGFAYKDWTFQTTPGSLSVMQSYIACAQTAVLMQTEYAVDFKLSDNRIVRIDRSDWLALSAALATWQNDLFTKKQTLKAAAAAAQTRNELEAVKW